MLIDQKVGHKFYQILTPKVMEMASKHFDCPITYGSDSLPTWGVPFEISGGDGSSSLHWESTVMGYDYMTAQISSHMLVTKITLGLFQDTGWYMPNYELAEDMWWGKGRGCDFLKHASCIYGAGLGDL